MPEPRHRSSAVPLAWLYGALIVYASLYPFAGWRAPGAGDMIGPRRTERRRAKRGRLQISEGQQLIELEDREIQFLDAVGRVLSDPAIRTAAAEVRLAYAGADGAAEAARIIQSAL